MPNSQLEQGAVGVAITELLLALLRQVGLEDLGRLRVVPLETVDYVADLLRPLLGVFAVHGGQFVAGVAGLREGKCSSGVLARTLPNTKPKMVGLGFPFVFVCGRKGPSARVGLGCFWAWPGHVFPRWARELETRHDHPRTTSSQPVCAFANKHVESGEEKEIELGHKAGVGSSARPRVLLCQAEAEWIVVKIGSIATALASPR